MIRETFKGHWKHLRHQNDLIYGDFSDYYYLINNERNNLCKASSRDDSNSVQEEIGSDNKTASLYDVETLESLRWSIIQRRAQSSDSIRKPSGPEEAVSNHI